MANLSKLKELLSIQTYLSPIGGIFYKKLPNGKNRKYIKAKCKCGNIKDYDVYSLLRGTKSCGCYRVEIVKRTHIIHGDKKNPLYSIWKSMKSRCYNPNEKAYPRYGGRGIDVCDDWKINYVSFRDWALKNGWVRGLNIDRENNDKGYSPQNCRVVTVKINQRNRRDTVYLTFGSVRKSLSEWAEIKQLSQDLIYDRIKLGWRNEHLLLPKLSKGMSYKTIISMQ